MTRPLYAVLLLSAAPAWAEVPTVLADTAPVHSLVAMVMGDLGTPELIVAPGTSPHDASLTPSEAQALTEADLIVWTGDAFLPWLGESIASLAPGAQVLGLLDTDGWEPLPLPEGERGHDHGHDGDDGAEAGAAGIDPHAWLDPDVAVAWLGHISSALAEADPDNADTYRQNTVNASEALVSMKFAIQDRLEPLAGKGYAVGHDAYRYLGRATGLPPSRAIAHSDGAEPAPSDIAALRDAVVSGEVQCLLLDAETNPSWADTLGEGATLHTAAVDPDGVTLEPGPGLYPLLMENLAASLESCLGP
jgi:zinc transport system substrate-binding protein